MRLLSAFIANCYGDQLSTSLEDQRSDLLHKIDREYSRTKKGFRFSLLGLSVLGPFSDADDVYHMTLSRGKYQEESLRIDYIIRIEKINGFLKGGLTLLVLTLGI